MTITYGSRDFLAAMNGAVVVAYPLTEPKATSVDDFAHLARVPRGIVSPADAAKTYWRWNVMPKTMQRLA